VRGGADRWPVAVLLAVGLAAFVVPALFGHPAIAGDNIIQNFPLRVLSGRNLLHGHLPLWNPYLWSGTPLLGGLNAGSAYPTTLAFVVLPPVGAWVVGLVAVYWAGSLGVYALVRQLGVRPLAALLAGLTYAYAGAMAGQMVHLGVVQGMGWMPWLLLAMIRCSWAVLGTGPRGGSPWPWVALLAATFGLIVLTGEPRAMAELEVVGTVAALWLVLRRYRDPSPRPAARLRLTGLLLLGAVWGAAIGAIQAVPGWHFISESQRASATYFYYGAGSLPRSWTALLLVPDLFGGDGIFHQPSYFLHYNLPEVVGYVGLVPLVAAVGLVVGHRRHDGRAMEWIPWLALAGLGLLLAWGSYTPLGHLFAHLPLFGRTRLQSRNLGVADLALAVLLGLWGERALGSRVEEAGLGPGRRWVSAVPALAAATLCLVAVAVPAAVEVAFGGTSADGVLGRDMTPWFLAQLVVAVAVVALVVGWRRLDTAGRRRWLTVVVVADVGLFVLSSSTGFWAGDATTQPSTATARVVLGTTGRFAIYHPGSPTGLLDELGQPDLNIFTGLASVQGYGSILSEGYGQTTGTHTLDSFDTCALAAGTFTQLRLSSMLALPSALTPPVPAGATVPAPPPFCPGESGRQRDFTLGRTVPLASVRLVDPSRSVPRVGVVGPDGSTTYPRQWAMRSGGDWTVTLATPRPVVGLAVSTPVAGNSVVHAADGGSFALDGPLQAAMAGPGWRYAGEWEGFARYRARRVLPPVWVVGGGASTASLVSSTPSGTWVVRVSATRPVEVVRSEAYLPGWSVQAVPAGGGAGRTLSVDEKGLVQAVRVPAGRWTLTFRYHPSGLDVGLGTTAAGLVALVVLAAVWWWRRSKHRASRHPAPAETGR
jgi:hypothetical protein